MKANELRLGNWLMGYDGKEFQWDLFSFKLLYANSLDADEIGKPIPLTEEWLLKLGFENGGYDLLFWDKGNIEICGAYIEGNGGFAWNWYDSNLSDGRHNQIEIQYVHQLQNLFHALTGEELAMKEKSPNQ